MGNTAVIVSDDKRTIDLLRGAMITTGFNGSVDVVCSSKELLDRLQELDATPPAVVFVDLSGLADGVRLVEWLRFSPRTRVLSIVAVGEESEAIAIFRNAWGNRAVLLKPLRPQAVQEFVAALNLRMVRAAAISRRDARRNLVKAIERSKKLRAEQERLRQQVETLVAELRDHRTSFKRKRVREDRRRSQAA